MKKSLQKIRFSPDFFEILPWTIKPTYSKRAISHRDWLKDKMIIIFITGIVDVAIEVVGILPIAVTKFSVAR